jgi:hypothetical protein
MPRDDVPRIQTWREPVDDAHIAVIAFCEFVRRGAYFAASAFLITDRRNWDWRGAGEQHFKDQLNKNNGGRLPYICRARERE